MFSNVIDYQPEDRPDAPVVLSQRSPVAHIPHICAFCDGGILPGDRYEVTVLIDEDGDFTTHKAHIAWECCSPHDWR